MVHSCNVIEAAGPLHFNYKKNNTEIKLGLIPVKGHSMTQAIQTQTKQSCTLVMTVGKSEFHWT